MVNSTATPTNCIKSKPARRIERRLPEDVMGLIKAYVYQQQQAVKLQAPTHPSGEPLAERLENSAQLEEAAAGILVKLKEIAEEHDIPWARIGRKIKEFEKGVRDHDRL